MTEHDSREFTELLLACFDILGKTPQAKIVSPTAQALFFTAMRRFPMPQVRAALAHHLEVGKFTPTPADLIGYITEVAGTDNRPGAEEAWSLGLSTLDEAKTVIWTQEAAEAFGKAQPVLESSGAISARKTFIEIYERLVTANRKQNRPPEWFASPGHDQDQRQIAMKEAVKAGLLAAPSRLQLTLTPSAEPPPPTTLQPAEQLAAIRTMLLESYAEKQRQADEAFKLLIEDEEDFKRDLAKRVAERERYIALMANPEQAKVDQAKRAAKVQRYHDMADQAQVKRTGKERGIE